MLADLCIESDGSVSRVVIVDSDLPEAFRELTVGNFSTVLFAPGERAGEPVRSVVRIEIRYAAPVAEPPPPIITKDP